MAPSTASAMELVLLVCLAASSVLFSHPWPDFISLHCGLAANRTYSTDLSSELRYISDANFTDAGLTAQVESRYRQNGAKTFGARYRTLRYFPKDTGGERSCYTVPLASPTGGKYLVRASFCYGNYDGLNRPPVFNLYLGVNHWATMNVTTVDYRYILEAVAVLLTDPLQVCLVNTGLGTPFISGLDLRPLKANMYSEATVNQSLVLLSLSRPSATFGFNRYQFWPPGYELFRLNYDPYDRLWQRYGDVAEWTNITTSDTIDVSNISSFEKPTAILRSAATPVNGTRMDFTWNPDSFVKNHGNATYLLLLYFAELERLPRNASRKFDILVDNATWNGSQGFTPKYLSAEVVQRMVQGPSKHTLSLVATPDATHSPILNAIEIYTVQPTTEIATNNADAKAVMTIRKTYALGALKKSWMGDPCAPKAFAWVGLNCSYSSSGPPRITTLRLSSSGMAGAVDSSFGDLKSLQYLDLSNNSLSGPVPNFLALMPSLTFLDLSSNKLVGPVPAALLEKRENGSLDLRIGSNKNISCDTGAFTCDPNKKKKNRTLIVATVVPIAAAILLLAAGLLIRHRMKNKIRANVFIENRQFTYNELTHMTSNFKEEIGRGGFGAVFLGYLEDGTPVAIKMRSTTSSQGDKEFLAEAEHLTRVHHRNLVSLIGYCTDKKHLALVYEYMQGGSLEERLRGEASAVEPLTWHERLEIALDSAQGLEYLHKLCQPPLIHRDVKTQNILLSSYLKAKIADFGLMKAFADDFRTHVTTVPAGTLGYLDPEYYNTSQLSEKSDVYSFGVVLLELITGQAPAVPISDTEIIHISRWVRQKLSEGNIESIVDPAMGGDYDVNSVWKVIELALQCKEQPSRTRPAMTDVVVELKECLELEVYHAMSKSNYSSANNLSGTNVDLQSETQASDYPRHQEQAVLELELVGVPSSTRVGPVPR